jgi:polar amino acid transport system substrate-binding protein
MKRTTFALLAVLLGLSLVLAGCGGKEEKVLILGTSPDYPPYENVDTTTGEIVGFDIDIAKFIAEELGYELKIEGMDFNGLVAALQAGRVDFVMAAMSVDPGRDVDFSDIYFVARNTIVSRDGFATLEELEGKRVGVQLGSTQEDVAEGIPNPGEIVPLNRIPEIIQEIKAGRLDAAIVEDAVAAGYVANNPDLTFNVIDTGEEEGYAVALPRGSELLDDINAALKKLEESGKKDELVKKWFE